MAPSLSTSLNHRPSTVPTTTEGVDLNNGWNHRNETLVIEIGRRAQAYKILHTNVAERLSYVSRAMNGILVTLSALNTAFLTLEKDDRGVKVTILGVLLSVISIINSYYQPDNKVTVHRHAASGYGAIEDRIQVLTCKFKTKREDAIAFIQRVQNDFNKVVDTAPAIGKWTLRLTFTSSDMASVNDNISFAFVEEGRSKLSIVNNRIQMGQFNPGGIGHQEVNEDRLREMLNASHAGQDPVTIMADYMQTRTRAPVVTRHPDSVVRPSDVAAQSVG